jgi:lantibiotic modifying enzyme
MSQLQHLVAAAACLSFPLAAQTSATATEATPTQASLRDTITQAITWIGAQAKPVKGNAEAVLFPAVAEQPGQIQPQVYGGNAGILIFLENAAAALPDERAKELADKVARGLLALRRKGDAPMSWMRAGMTEGATSLYVGDAGIGHAFLVRARLRRDQDALQVATDVGDSIIARGTRDGDVLSWDKQSEVIYGAAGTILFLLDLAAHTNEKRFVDAAQAASRWLIKEADTGKQKNADGADQRVLSWRWALANNQPYVNFSHGTAGIAYALARVGAVANDAACAQAALAGAAWLDSMAQRDADKVVWPAVAGSDRTMGGWCHGPPGTGRLYLLLHQITGEARYLDTALASARWVMAQAPAAQEGQAPPAFPPSFCCGVAGVLDFFCDLYRATRAPEFKAFAQRAGDYLIAAAKPDGDGVKWAQGATAHGARGNYHSLDLMLGAPGEALALLRLLTIDTDPDPVVHLPDRRVAK